MKQPSQEDREPTPEELAKAERVTWILYGAMAVLISAPLIVGWLMK
ncbi:hypothetical protein [Cerasicoccus arenae]|nr:hypothetical protein [Cerasicoccus arenae]MBK1856811.1 hypothetical protein [Cerasicoccus arenae]